MIADINFNLRWWKRCDELGHGPQVSMHNTHGNQYFVCTLCWQHQPDPEEKTRNTRKQYVWNQQPLQQPIYYGPGGAVIDFTKITL